MSVVEFSFVTELLCERQEIVSRANETEISARSRRRRKVIRVPARARVPCRR